MPSIRARTPYPAAAQLFFRLVVTIHETSRAMKWALVALRPADDLGAGRWLRATERSAWLALVYAWNPLVILEVAHSGHIDALGALWIAIAAWMLTTGRGDARGDRVRHRRRAQAAADRADAALLEADPVA